MITRAVGVSTVGLHCLVHPIASLVVVRDSLLSQPQAVISPAPKDAFVGSPPGLSTYRDSFCRLGALDIE